MDGLTASKIILEKIKSNLYIESKIIICSA